jgi:hypothetical protein
VLSVRPPIKRRIIMKLSVTIPQLFYDLIARMLPGFLFLFMLGFELSGTGTELIPQGVLSSNSIATILMAIVCGILFYLMGWVLRAFTFLSVGEKVKAKYESKAKNAISISEMYNRIRIENEAVGFRITKLRAEARMLEASRVGMAFVFVISAGLLLLHALALLPMIGQSTLGWGYKLGVPLILAVAFRRCERGAWNRYYDNVTNHYEILFKTRAAKQQGRLQGKD